MRSCNCSWRSSICRQKRILILLCTFGSSFIAFNYSLLSSSSSSRNQVLSSYSTTKTDEEENLNYRQTIAELDNNKKTLMKQGQQKLVTFPQTFSNSIYSSSSRKVSDRSDNTPPKNKIRSLPLEADHFTSHPLLLTSHYTPKLSNFRFQKRITSKKQITATERHSTSKAFTWVTPSTSIKVGIEDYYNYDNGTYYNYVTNRDFLSQNENRPLSMNVNKTEGVNKHQALPSLSAVIPAESKERSIIMSDRDNEEDAVTPNILPLTSIQFPLPGSLSPTSPFPHSTSPRPPQHEITPRPKSNGKSSSNNSNHPHAYSSLSRSSGSKSNLLSPFHIPPCNATFQLRRIQKRKKNLTVIENFIMGWKRFKCNETITYTTHADYRYFDNLVPLVDRWNGPVSLAVYCPGEDLQESLKLISYFKLCASSNIDKWVTFHLIYDIKYVKKPTKNYTKSDIPWLDALYKQGKWKDCSQKPTFSKANHTFRIHNGLLYPINIARNIARAAATTYFVLASDIELYPSINLIGSFMKMLGRIQKEEEARLNYNSVKDRFTAAAAAVVAKLFFSSGGNPNNSILGDGTEEKIPESVAHQNSFQQRLSDLQHQDPSRHVFVLPVFEVKKDIEPCQVETKEQLVSLLKKKSAVLFHHSICPQCHKFPKYEEWKNFYQKSNASISNTQKQNCSTHSSNLRFSQSYPKMRMFHKAKRMHPHGLWEPIFIGTKKEPIYDERLSWEGLRDKMVSGYIMCALDYDFYILDSAFLVHKPGIRRVSHLTTKTVMSQDRLINYRIRSELLKKYGKHDECAL